MKVVNSIKLKFSASIVLLGILGLGATIATIGYFNSTRQANIAHRTAQLPKYGIAVGGNLPELSATDVEARLTEISKFGGGWIRLDFEWNRIQPDTSQDYDWETYDRIVEAINRHNLKIIGILDFTPSWARLPECSSVKQCVPANPAHYAAFAGQVAKRYHNLGLHYWEIWNEPNTTTFFQPRPNPTLYTEMLRAAYKAIHAEDPLAIVITGPAAPSSTAHENISPTDFLIAIYNHHGGESFDAVGAHPYTYPVGPNFKSEHAWASLSTTPVSLRSIMIAHGDKLKKIWLTEFGAPTDGPGHISTPDQPNLNNHPDHVSEDLQADILREGFLLHAQADWAGPLLIYSDRDAGVATDTNENFFGLIRADGSPKKAYDIFINQTATNGP